MIILQKDESLRRRFPAKMKKFGNGTFYLTTQRMCFEADRHGLCLDLGYIHLFDWQVKKRSIVVRWSESERGYTNTHISKPEFEVEIYFERKKFNGENLTIQNVHYSIYFALINFWNYGEKGSGFYRYAGEIYSHFFAFRSKNRPIPYIQLPVLYMEIDVHTQTILLGEKGCKKIFGEIVPDMDKTLLGHEMYARDRIISAYTLDKRNYSRETHDVKEDPGDFVGRWIKLRKMAIQNCIFVVGDLTKKIEKYEAEYNMEELENTRPPGIPGGLTYQHFQGGTIYAELDHWRDALAIERRTLELYKEKASENVFGSSGAVWNYLRETIKQLTIRCDQGRDISKFVPDVKIIPPYIIQAQKDIEEHRKMVTEAV